MPKFKTLAYLVLHACVVIVYLSIIISYMEKDIVGRNSQLNF